MKLFWLELIHLQTERFLIVFKLEDLTEQCTNRQTGGDGLIKAHNRVFRHRMNLICLDVYVYIVRQ